MDLNRLRTFKILAETRSFTETAKTIFVTQSAVSQQIKLLQEDLGYSVVQKVNGHLELTPKGRTLYEKINLPLSRLANEVTANADQTRSHYKIMGPYSYLSEVFALKMKTILPHDLLQFFIGNSEQCLDALESGKIDFAILTNQPNSKLIESHILLEEQMLLVKNPTLQFRSHEPIPVVGMDPQLSMFNKWMSANQKSNYNPTCYASIESVYGIINFILKFPCAGIAPEYLVTEYLKQKKLISVDNGSRKLKNNIYLCILKKNKSTELKSIFEKLSRTKKLN